MRAALVCTVVASLLLEGVPLIGVRCATAQKETSVESRQNYPHTKYANNFLYYRPLNSNHRFPNSYPSRMGYYPHNYGYGYDYGSQQHQQQQGFMEILEAIAARDELHCVSKILCEMASSGNRDNYSYKKPSGLINMDSLGTLLAGIDDKLASPIVKFGKAFVLGYTARHNSQCQYAYPRCPSNPDRLVNYLNNQNGNLLSLLNNFNFVNFPSPNRRIQNGGKRRPLQDNSFHIHDYSASGDKRQYAWQFPSYDDSQIHNYENDGGVHHKKGKSLKFPNEHNKYENENDYIRSSALPFYFPDNHQNPDEEISTTQHYHEFVFRELLL